MSRLSIARIMAASALARLTPEAQPTFQLGARSGGVPADIPPLVDAEAKRVTQSRQVRRAAERATKGKTT